MNMYSTNAPKNLGILLAGAWFILYGVVVLIDLSFSGLSTVRALLGLAAGIALILDLYR